MILSASNLLRTRWLASSGHLQNPGPFPSLMFYRESFTFQIRALKGLTEKQKYILKWNAKSWDNKYTKKILRQYSTKTNVVREKNAENKKRINLVVKNVLKL